jgi:hypothetical protein
LKNIPLLHIFATEYRQIPSSRKSDQKYPPQIKSTMTTVLSMMTENRLPPPPISYVPSISAPTLTPFIPFPVPKYIHKYPQIYDATQYIRELISEWKGDTAQGAYELEARFGKWQGQHFQSGVSKPFTEKILNMFDTFAQWSRVTDWEETHDYYYANHADQNVPMVRTTASFRTDSKTGRKRIVTEHIRKYPRHKIDFQYVTTSPLVYPDFRYDLRICLNYEERVSEQELPSIVNPSSVRIKSRKSFYYKSEEFPSAEPLWKFDVTRSWNGASRTEAELKQKNGDIIYELELECLNPRGLMVSPQHDSFYVACSMLLKMKDFLTHAGSTEFKWEPIQRPPVSTHDVQCF